GGSSDLRFRRLERRVRDRPFLHSRPLALPRQPGWRNDGEDAQHCLTQAAQGPECHAVAKLALALFRSHGRAAAKSQTKNESGCLKHVVPMTQMAVDYGQQLPCQPPCQEASP